MASFDTKQTMFRIGLATMNKVACVALPSAFIVLNENRKAAGYNKMTGVWRSECGARVLNGTIPVPIFGTVEDDGTKELRVRHASGRAESFRVSRCDTPKNRADVPERCRHLRPDPEPMKFEMTETTTGRVVECEATEFSSDTICGSYTSVAPVDRGSFVLRFGYEFSRKLDKDYARPLDARRTLWLMRDM